MKYLFITGWQRTGTTLMTRALNAHPRITVVYQPFSDFFQECINIFYRDILKIKIPQNKPLLDKIEPCYERLKNSFSDIFFYYEDINRLTQSIKNRVSEDKESAPFIVSHLQLLKPGPAQEILISLFNIVKHSYGNDDTELVGFKELYCEPFIEIFANVFDTDLYYIQMIRDPRAVYASRNTGAYLEKAGKKYPLLFILDNWKRSYAYYRRYNKKISTYMPIFYEQFVCEPEKTLRKIFDHMGIAFNSSVLNVNNYVDGFNCPWHGNSSHYNSLNTIDESTINKWKSSLRRIDIGAIEFVCKQEMEDSHYSLYSSHFRIFDFFRFRENYSDLSDWLKNSGYILTTQKKLCYCFRQFTRGYLSS